jgi:hypothetical protein
MIVRFLQRAAVPRRPVCAPVFRGVAALAAARVRR